MDTCCPTYWRGWGRGIAWTKPSSSRTAYTTSQGHVSKTKFFLLDCRSVKLCGGVHSKSGFPESLKSPKIIRGCFMKLLLVHFQDCWQLVCIFPKSLTCISVMVLLVMISKSYVAGWGIPYTYRQAKGHFQVWMCYMGLLQLIDLIN